MFYVFIVLIIVVVFFISNMSPSTITQGSNISLDNSRIENATKSIAPKIEEVMLAQEKIREKKRLAATFKILPKDNLWVGYINLNTGEKLQKTFRDELSLDPNGHWLLTLGHGNVDFDISGKLKQYQTSRNLRFLYKDGKLKKIGAEEFTRLNKGEKW